jgi:acetolactate synthase-1/2/3 large subunit
LRGADLLADSLVASGIDTIFGVPGDTGVVFYDALYTRTDRLRHVLARDERHAAAMADAFARVTNRVGVVEVSSGGGTTYVVGGLGEAYAAGVPVLLITSDIHVNSRDTGALTEIDQLALFSAVTKWRRVVESADDIPDLVAEALRQATSGRPAPVALIFPENILDETTSTAVLAVSQAGLDRLPATRTSAEDAAVREAARLLSQASRPAIVAGSGVHLSQAWAALAELADRGGIPVATTIHGKGAIADANPWSLGVVGNNGARDYANDYLREADAVLFVGTRANATDTNSWSGPRRTGTPVIQIDVDASRAGRNFPDSVALAGDAREVLGQLVHAVTEVAATIRSKRQAWIAEAKARWATAGPVGTTTLRDGELLPADLVRVLNEVLGPKTVVIADPGTPTPNIASYWETTEPGRTIVVPRGHGPMGYAIPAAVGAAFARPGEPIVSITADGSFAMACGELETIARFGLPVLFLQLTNDSLGWIKMLQHLYTGRRYFGVDPGPIDAVGVAVASGLRAARIDDLNKFRELVVDFAENPAPLYIDVKVPHMIDYTPPVPAWLEALDGNAERPVY